MKRLSTKFAFPPKRGKTLCAGCGEVLPTKDEALMTAMVTDEESVKAGKHWFHKMCSNRVGAFFARKSTEPSTVYDTFRRVRVQQAGS